MRRLASSLSRTVLRRSAPAGLRAAARVATATTVQRAAGSAAGAARARAGAVRAVSTSAALRSSGAGNVAAPTAHSPLTVLSDEEESLRQTVAKFAAEHLPREKVKAMDRDQKLDLNVLQALFQNGLMGVEIPSDFGGLGLTFTQSCLVIEELAKVDPAVAVIVDIQNTLINTAFRKYASAEQQKHYLPRLAADTLVSFCLSEQSSGSDAFAMKTTAKLSADKKHYTLNGTKMWISNAAEAGLYVVFANADPSKGYKGITAFIVEKGSKGLSIGKKEDKLGIRCSSTCEVIFDDVHVPAANVLGSVGQGYKIAIELLNEGRIGIGAQMVGLAQGAFDAAMPYVHQRKQFGAVIATFQGMQFGIAQARTDIEAARLMVYNAARLKDSGRAFVMEAAMAKLYSSQVAERVASKAIEWCGGVGFTKEFDNEKFFRDAKIGSIYEGTTNLQLQTIAKLISKDFK